MQIFLRENNPAVLDAAIGCYFFDVQMETKVRQIDILYYCVFHKNFVK